MRAILNDAIKGASSDIVNRSHNPVDKLVKPIGKLVYQKIGFNFSANLKIFINQEDSLDLIMKCVSLPVSSAEIFICMIRVSDGAISLD